VGDSLFVVRQGEVAVRVHVDGSTADVATVGPGDIFGEMSVLTGENRAATCIARSETACYVIDRSAFEEVLEERPEIAEHFSSTLARRQTELESQREELSATIRARREADRRRQILSRVRELFGIT
jgi:CRP-like cAMP-binding protein